MSTSSDYKFRYADHPYNSLFASFMKEERAIERTYWWLKKLEGYEKYIPLYPEVKCEPLELVYTFYRDASHLDPDVLTDCINLSHRTGFWALWLVLITPNPRPEYAQIITDHIHFYEGPEDGPGDWFPALVLQYLNGQENDHKVLQNAARFREFLSQMPKRVMPLRPAPNDEDLLRIKKRNEVIRQIYKNEGADAALLFLRDNREIWDLSYEDWARSFVTCQL